MGDFKMCVFPPHSFSYSDNFGSDNMYDRTYLHADSSQKKNSKKREISPFFGGGPPNEKMNFCEALFFPAMNSHFNLLFFD